LCISGHGTGGRRLDKVMNVKTRCKNVHKDRFSSL
jgi:hypothetical protein